MPRENVEVAFSGSPGNLLSIYEKCTRATLTLKAAQEALASHSSNAASASMSLGSAVSQSASSVVSLGGAMRNAGVETYNNHLGMTCQKVFGVSLAVNAVTGAFKALVSQWRHALDVQLELVAAERLLPEN
jgi:hypothetical protein